MTRLLCIVLLMMVLSATPVSADDVADDFARGVQAYDGGRVTEALDAWRRAAQAGHSSAMTALANVYQYGERVPRDPTRAAVWYRKAAEQSDVTAQLNLGDLYRRGLGVPKNNIKSYVWLSLAARQGNAWALETKRKLVETMTEEERRQAFTQLQKFKKN